MQASTRQITSRARAMSRSRGGERHRLLSIYLNDHAALGVAAVELARRAAAGHAGTAFGDQAASLTRELEAQAAALERVMAAVGVRRNPLKHYGARVGERLGRLKLNGHVRSASPLSPVVEAEGLLGTVGSFAILWRGLDSLHDDRIAQAADCAALARAARDMLSDLEERRLELLRSALVA